MKNLFLELDVKYSGLSARSGRLKNWNLLFRKLYFQPIREYAGMTAAAIWAAQRLWPVRCEMAIVVHRGRRRWFSVRGAAPGRHRSKAVQHGPKPFDGAA
ncbi:MAG: hypothetical protein ACRYGK_08785 [Janthinobacterium lividum]